MEHGNTEHHGNPSQTKAKLILIALFLCLSFQAKADPCEATLGGVDPGGAAAARADETRARQRVQEEYDHAKSKDGDAQYKPEDAAQILEAASQHHKTETGLYAAGIGKAMMKGDFKSASTLMQCVQKRSAQAGADDKAAEENRKIGEKVTQEDPGTIGLGSYTPRVVTVDQ